MSGYTIWRYRRRFRIGDIAGQVIMRSRTSELRSELYLGDNLVGTDRTPAYGPEAIRNHRIAAELPDGAKLDVEAGYIGALNMGIAVRRDDRLVHESHPGRTIAYPDKYRQMTISMGDVSMGEALRKSFSEGTMGGGSNGGIDFGKLKRNRIPLLVDIVLGLLFFVVAKLTDLTTAALVGAAAGLLLLIAQRLTKVDLLGGLALFGIGLLLLSALLAIMFQSDEAVKYRSSVVGIVSAVLFFGDGLAGGRRLATRLVNYLPYSDLDAARLGLGMGVLGMVLAALNLVVAQYASTDTWLFYSTFADFLVAMMLMLAVFSYAQGKLLPEAWPRYTPTDGGE